MHNVTSFPITCLSINFTKKNQRVYLVGTFVVGLVCIFYLISVAPKKTVTASKTAGGSSKPTTSKGSAAGGAGGKAKAAPGGGGGKQKRAPWDLKGRLQDMEVMMADERKFSSNTIGDLQTQVYVAMCRYQWFSRPRSSLLFACGQ